MFLDDVVEKTELVCPKAREYLAELSATLCTLSRRWPSKSTSWSPWVIEPELPTDAIERVEIESVFSKATQVIAWRELQDDSLWRQGWV